MKKQAGNSAINLLDCFSLETPELNMSEISRISGCPKASTSRHLKALKLAGLVKYNPGTRKFSLGYKILKLYEIFSNTTTLNQVALKYMEELRDLFNQTVSLIVVEGTLGVIVERLVNNDYLKYMPQIGVGTPLYAGSKKVLLAYLREEKIREIISQGLERFTPNTITKPDILLKELQRIRETGYSISNSEINPWIKSISVPIWFNNTVIAGLVISGPPFKITEEEEQAIVLEMQRRSENISKELGHLIIRDTRGRPKLSALN